MYLSKIPNRNSNPTYLIRKSEWVNGKVRKITLANITKLPPEFRDAIGALLKGGILFKSLEESFEIRSNKAHGHVAAVLGMMNQLGLPELIAPKNTRNRRLILGMIATRVLHPYGGLSARRFLDADTASTTLNEELGLESVDEHDLHKAMNELVKRKLEIECSLAKRHLKEGGMVLYDAARICVENNRDKFDVFGYDQDQSDRQVVIGLITDRDGRPVSLDVFPGETKIAKTLSAQVNKIQEVFGLRSVIITGDRGILSQKRLRRDIIPAGLNWITAMNKRKIYKVVKKGMVQMSLFDEKGVVEVHSDLYPGEKLVLSRNFLQAEESQQRLDGTHAIRSSLKDHPGEELMANYGRLSLAGDVLRTFRILSWHLDSEEHCTQQHLAGHVFLSMLSFYVEYHMRKKLAPMLSEEDNLEEEQEQGSSPAKSFQTSLDATKNVRDENGTEYEAGDMSFEDVLKCISGLCRLTVVSKTAINPKPTVMMGELSSTQRNAFELLNIEIEEKANNSKLKHPAQV